MSEVKLIAYHGKPEIKSAILLQLEGHRKADELVKGALAAGVISVDIQSGLVYGHRWRRGRPRGCVNNGGYIVFTLHFSEERLQIKAHRAVWLAAHGVVPAGLVIDHKNRNRSDNRLSNLRAVSAWENAQNRRSYLGAENPAAKINQGIANAIRAERNAGASYAAIACSFCVSKSLVAQIVRGERWI